MSDMVPTPPTSLPPLTSTEPLVCVPCATWRPCSADDDGHIDAPFLPVLRFPFALPLNHHGEVRDPRPWLTLKGAGCAGSVSTPVCSDFLKRRLVRGLWPPSVSFSVAEVVSMEEAAAVVQLALAFAPGLPGSPL